MSNYYISSQTLILSSMNSPSPPPQSIKTRFAAKFLQAMKKLNKNRSSPSSMAERYKRCLAVKAVACASMASTVGPRRVWSRAVLRKMKRHTLHPRKKGLQRRNPRKLFGQEDHLRCLVPGGKGMEFCSLLAETSHYIKCLQAQVNFQTVFHLLFQLHNSGHVFIYHKSF